MDGREGWREGGPGRMEGYRELTEVSGWYMEKDV